MSSAQTALAGIALLSACTGPIPTVTEVEAKDVPAGTYLVPKDISDDGIILVMVGSMTGVVTTAGLLSESGDLTQYSLPAGYTSCAPAKRANDGTVAGDCYGQPETAGLNAARFAVFWDASGAIHEIDTRSGKPAYAVDINDSGLVVGYTVEGTNDLAWLYDLHAQTLTALPLPAGARGARAEAINADGDIVGTASFAEEPPARAVVWERDTTTPRLLARPTLPSPGNNGGTYASDINTNGVILGFANGRPAIWSAVTAAPQTLPEPAPPPGKVTTHCSAAAIDDQGRIIGACWAASPGSDFATHRGVFWTSDHRPLALEENSFPIAINASGRVVASVTWAPKVALIDW